MLNLIYLLILPILFIGCLLFVSNNYQRMNIIIKTNRLKQVIILEESSYIIPYVLRKYYSHIIDVRSNLMPSFITTSYWYENMQLIKDKGLIIQNVLKTKILKRISIVLALVLYGLIILFWFKYRRSILSYQLLTNTGSKNEIWNLDISLGLDGLSLPFLALIGFIFPIVYLSNWSTIDHLDINYHLIIISLELFLIVVFLVIDLIMFYVFFESILPPLFVLIGLYGATQKFRAGYYLFLYTLFGSLFMLLTFVKMGSDTGTSFYEGYTNHSAFTGLQELIWIILFVSFSVKTPLIPVHIWLPLAHSDANVSGSIILASIVLKLALYGFIRILIAIFFFATMRLTPFFLGLCSMSVIYSSLTTIRQFDLKVLVAYSSIAHMASSLLGTFSDTLYGLVGSIVFGLAHGFVSPGLFIVVGAVLYDRCGSRIINYYRGLNGLLPFLSLLFLILVFGNMGVPLTGNFMGEFLSLLGAYQQNMFIANIGALSIILSAVYSVFMYNRITSGSLSPYIHTIPDIFRKEYYILAPLILLTIILGIYPSFITSDLEFGLSNFLFISGVPLIGNSVINKSKIKWESTTCPIKRVEITKKNKNSLYNIVIKKKGKNRINTFRFYGNMFSDFINNTLSFCSNRDEGLNYTYLKWLTNNYVYDREIKVWVPLSRESREKLIFQYFIINNYDSEGYQGSNLFNSEGSKSTNFSSGSGDSNSNNNNDSNRNNNNNLNINQDNGNNKENDEDKNKDKNENVNLEEGSENEDIRSSQFTELSNSSSSMRKEDLNQLNGINDEKKLNYLMEELNKIISEDENLDYNEPDEDIEENSNTNPGNTPNSNSNRGSVTSLSSNDSFSNEDTQTESGESQIESRGSQIENGEDLIVNREDNEGNNRNMLNVLEEDNNNVTSYLSLIGDNTYGFNPFKDNMYNYLDIFSIFSAKFISSMNILIDKNLLTMEWIIYLVFFIFGIMNSYKLYLIVQSKRQEIWKLKYYIKFFFYSNIRNKKFFSFFFLNIQYINLIKTSCLFSIFFFLFSNNIDTSFCMLNIEEELSLSNSLFFLILF